MYERDCEYCGSHFTTPICYETHQCFTGLPTIGERIAARIQNLLSTKYTNTQKIVAGIIDQELRAVERAA